MAKEKLEKTNLVQDHTYEPAIFQAMAENAVDGMVLSTLEGVITYANPADYALFGYNLETREMVGLPLSRFFSENSLKMLVEEAIPQSLDGASWQGEVRGIRKDGTPFDLLTAVFAIRDEQGDPIALTAVLRDLTERKRVEEALQQREAVLGAIALAAEKFLRPSDWEQDIRAALAYLGKAADAIRVIIWEGSTSEDGKYLISGRYEWLAPEAKLAPLQGQQNVPVFRRWRDLLPRGEIITGHVKDLSAKEQEFFVPRGIKSVLVVPIFVNGVWWGFMGFDQGGTEREWTEAEIDALKTAVSILGGALERKRAEEALRESEENFRALADNANDGIMIAAGRGAHVYANRRMAEITGYSVPELLKTTMADLVHPDQLKEVRERFQRRLEGKPAPRQYEIVFVRKDGKSVALEMTSAKTVWRGQPATIVVFRDITERKWAEEALRESEEKYRNLVERANDGIVIIQDTLLKYANPRTAEIVGYTVEELTGTPFIDYVHPEELPKVMDRYKQRMAGEDVTPTYGTVFRHRDGSKIYAEINAGIVTYQEKPADLVIIRDITERKRTEEALRASEERFALAVQGSNDGIWDWDIQNDSLYWSPRLKELLGYADDELDVDFEVFDSHLHPDDKEHTQAAIEAHLKDRGLYNVEQRLRTKSGQYRWFRARGQALWDEAGNPLRMVGSIAEITEHKQAEANLERRAVQLQAAAEVSRTTTSVLDPDELLRQVVDLVRERFDLYYAGLFLVDETGEGTGEPGRWAVLRAGTGEAGRRMLEAGHKLAVGGESMIGWCIANAQARIALDVGEEAVRFDNPLLPETRSEMALPLVSRGQVIGAMTIQSTQAAAFSQEDITILQTMADQLANAIENARLFEEALARTREMTALAKTAGKLASALELDAILDSIMDACLEFFQVQQACFIMMDEDGYLRMRRQRGLSEEFVRSIVGRPGEGFFGKVYQSGEAILVRDARKQLDPDTGEAVLREGVTSFVHVPVKVKGETVAVMNLTSLQEERRFSERDLERLSAFADQAAIAIENARLFEETQRHAVQLRIVNEVSRTLTSILDVDTLLGQVVRLIRDTFGYYQINLGLIEGDALVPKAWAGALSIFPTEIARLDLNAEAVVTKVVNSGTLLLVPDVRQEPLYLPLPGLEKVRSELAVPLKSKGQVIGVLDVESDRLAAFDERDLTVLEALAGQIAVAIENARLFQEAQSRLQEQTMLFTISQRLAGASLEFKEVAEVIVRQFVEVMGVLECSLSLLDPKEGTLEVIVDLYADERGAKTYREEVEEIYRLKDYPATAHVVETLQPLVVQASDPDADPAERAYMQKHELATLVVLPVVVKGQAVGIIELETWDEERHYTPEQLNLAMTLANQAAVALENARLFQETKANLEEITLLHRRYLQEAWSEFLEEKTGGERVGYMYDDGIVSPASTVWRPEIGLAVQRGDTIALSEMADTLQGTVEEVGAILETSAESALAVPLKVRDQVIGALDFYETDQARDWSAEDIAMVETVANQVALAIENARAYEELQKRAEQLREMDRLKTQFLANMSHELRTPLNSIIGFSRVILKGIDGPITEQQRADLTSIHNNGQHLLAMINDILDISKIEASKMELIFEPVDMQQIISGVMSTAAALVEDKSIELKQEVAPDLPIIRADGTRVRQVILNLLSNAAKFTEEGQITLRAWADEEQITISVKDTGIGIPLEHQTTIFEEFRQVDASTTRRTGGTGLGLAISRHFVEMHGGRIWVESEPDVGSTFTFTLPITGPAPIAEPELADLTIDTNCKLILAVEDDEGAISIYKRYLEKRGYQVVGLNQGQQAVRWAQELAPYAIILDVLLSDKDGWTVLEELKSSRESHQIPVIICTIIDDEEARGLSLGAADYLVKPILEEDLLQSLQRLEERQWV